MLNSDKMSEIKINKEIKTKTKASIEEIKYKVKNLSFSDDRATLFGTMVINKKSKDFYMDFENSDETEYDFKNHNGGFEFDEALSDFYDFHVVELSKNEKDKNGNIVVKKTIKIK